MNEIQEIFASFIFFLPDELNFLFGLFGFLVNRFFFTLFTVVVKKTEKINDSLVGSFAVIILIVNGFGLNGKFRQTEDKKKLIKGNEIQVGGLAQLIIHFD